MQSNINDRQDDRHQDLETVFADIYDAMMNERIGQGLSPGQATKMDLRCLFDDWIAIYRDIVHEVIGKEQHGYIRPVVLSKLVREFTLSTKNMLMAECLGFLHRLAEIDNVEHARKTHLQPAIRNEVPDIQNIKIDTSKDSARHLYMYRDNLNPRSDETPSNLGFKVSLPDEISNQQKHDKPTRSIHQSSKDLRKSSMLDDEISREKPSRHTNRVDRQRKYPKTLNRLKNKIMTPISQMRREIMQSYWAIKKKKKDNLMDEDIIRNKSNDKTSMKEDEKIPKNTKDKADNIHKNIERKTYEQILRKTYKYKANEIKTAPRAYRKSTKPIQVLRYPKISESQKNRWVIRKLALNNMVKKVKALDQKNDKIKGDKIQKSSILRKISYEPRNIKSKFNKSDVNDEDLVEKYHRK